MKFERFETTLCILISIFILLFVILFIIFAPTALGLENKLESKIETKEGIVITKIMPEKISFNEKILVEISLENKGNKEVNILLKERIPENVEFDRENAKYIEMTEYNKKIWYYEWEFNLLPYDKKTIYYYLSPINLGDILIYPSEININGERYMIGSNIIKVTCIPDNVCGENENVINCPEDCQTGIKDGVCDAVKDNRVDPDCKEREDPDDTLLFEEKIGKANKKSSLLIYGAFFVIFIIIIGIIMIIYKIAKKIAKRKRKE